MPSEIEPSGTIQHPAEGFSIRWSRRGLEIQVTDYHATRLRLSWSSLLELASRAIAEPTSARATVEEQARQFRPSRF